MTVLILPTDPPTRNYRKNANCVFGTFLSFRPRLLLNNFDSCTCLLHRKAHHSVRLRPLTIPPSSTLHLLELCFRPCGAVLSSLICGTSSISVRFGKLCEISCTTSSDFSFFEHFEAIYALHHNRESQ